MPRNALLTSGDVAELLSVSPRMVIELAASGTLPAVRVGRLWRYAESDVEAYIETHRTAAPLPVPIRQQRAVYADPLAEVEAFLASRKRRGGAGTADVQPRTKKTRSA